MTKVRILKPDPKRKARVGAALEKIRLRLLRRFPFIGNVAMRLDLVPVMDSRVNTACTDGSRVFFDCAFFSSLKPGERLFVLAHEVWHVALLHFARRGSRDHELFNVAADLEIHFVLEHERLEEPFVLPHDPAWRSLPAEQIYERLLRQAPPAPPSAPHPGRDIVDAADAADATPGEGVVSVRIDPDFAPCVTRDAADRVRSTVRDAAQRTGFSPKNRRGWTPGGFNWLVRSLRRPTIDWRIALRRFVVPAFGGRRRWLPPNRRHVADGLYLPSRREERLRAMLALDTSGSTAFLLPSFFAELAGLLRSFGRYELTVVQCDAEVQRVDRWTDISPPPALAASSVDAASVRRSMMEKRDAAEWGVQGGGGTDFRPVFEWAAKERLPPDVLVFLTDGMGPAPERKPRYPVLWILPDIDGFDLPPPASWGGVLRIPVPTPEP